MVFLWRLVAMYMFSLGLFVGWFGFVDLLFGVVCWLLCFVVWLLLALVDSVGFKVECCT